MSETQPRKAVKKVNNAVLFSDGSIRIENVRASYPHVGKPQENKDDAGNVTSSYAITALMPKATHREAKDLIKQRIELLLKENKIKAVAADRKFIKDGDTMAKDENEGMWVVSCREKNQPALRHRKKDPATGKAMRLTAEQAERLIYGGCYVAVLFKPWWQNNKYGKRVNANLLAVQFMRDGEPFGEGRIREEDVDDSFEADEAEDDTGGFDDDTDGL